MASKLKPANVFAGGWSAEKAASEPKGLQAFSRAQRKDPDNARCLLCVNEHISEPWAHVEKDGDVGEEDSDGEPFSDTVSNAYTGEPHTPGSDVNSLASGFNKANLNELDKFTSDITEKKKGSTVATESNLIGSHIGNWKGKGKAKENMGDWQNFAGSSRGKGIAHTGYDSKGGAHAQVREPSMSGSERSAQIVTENRSERSGFARSPKASNNPGFANPLPGPPQRRPDDIIDQLKASATGRTVTYSDEDDSEEEEWGTL
ncbi:MAG: hypothetical protein Q9166_000252 [cf. Caloplaca sp. 2 TL-2023]